MPELQADLTEQEYRLLAERAEAKGLTVDAYLHQLIDTDLQEPPDRRLPENSNLRSIFSYRGKKAG